MNLLITGGTGTLGHAIVMSAERENWNYNITIYARSELRLAEMKRLFPHINTVVGDVRDYDRLCAAVSGHDLVIHAAAMKRIPECEKYPRECYLTNIEGSSNVARACHSRVSRVIGISTDKACQAITMYGASKLATESIFMSYKGNEYTQYSVVRYGNVVASNGSIIPLWQHQYSTEQKLSITDKRMTRFWMSPFDAVKTIKRSMQMPDVIYVPKIAACKMTSLAEHLFPGCQFDEIGLRSNEKMHESLVSPDEFSVDHGDHFVVGVGELGNSYTSLDAVPLRMDDFDHMLLESREVEH